MELMLEGVEFVPHFLIDEVPFGAGGSSNECFQEMRDGWPQGFGQIEVNGSQGRNEKLRRPLDQILAE